MDSLFLFNSKDVGCCNCDSACFCCVCRHLRVSALGFVLSLNGSRSSGAPVKEAVEPFYNRVTDTNGSIHPGSAAERKPLAASTSTRKNPTTLLKSVLAMPVAL